jgi:hypothetical protein
MDQRREALQAHLDKWRGRKIDYSGFDCGRFASDWAGVDLGPYTGKRDALRYLVKRGVRRSADIVSLHLEQLPSVTQARWGDIVAMNDAPLDPLGICEGSRCIFLDGAGGFVRRPLRQCWRAWRVN